MSRWICIDDICIPSDENDWEELVAFADAIAEQEPIDIVRCQDCKYWVYNYEAVISELRAERQAIIKMLDSDVSNKQKLQFIESFADDWKRKRSK